MSISGDSGLWVDLFICFLVWLFVMVWLVWHKWLRRYMDHPLDHYLGSHTHCKYAYCEKAERWNTGRHALVRIKR